MSVSDLFSDPLLGWGLRGDPYLWSALQSDFDRVPIPDTDSEFEAILHRQIAEHLGQSLDSGESVYVEKFAHGGMSSGQVSLEYWRETALPLLLHRYRVRAVRAKLPLAEAAEPPSICTVVQCALAEARNDMADHQESDLGKLHRRRSLEFVERLSDCLLACYPSSASVASLSKHHSDYRREFGMNELLFDVAVVEYGEVAAAKSTKRLSYAERGLWLVESEMAKNSREALFDFNKLVLGAADNLLFVGPHVANSSAYLGVLGPAAQHCRGNVYVALIPHPKEWYSEYPESAVVWQWRGREWARL